MELLCRAGLHVGTRLMQANAGNVRGYFENLSFYEFHREVLSAMREPASGFCLSRYRDLPEPWPSRAQGLLEQERRPGPWGWKDPRSVLFLGFWEQLCPTAPFLFLFRNPWCVVDSLFRRGDARLRRQPQRALDCWMHYNREILAFRARRPERCVLVEAEWVLESPRAFLELTSSKLGVDLTVSSSVVPDRGLYQGGLTLPYEAGRLAELMPEAIWIYRELRQASEYESLVADQPRLADSVGTSSTEDRAAFFQDWFARRAPRAPLDG